MTMGQNLGPWLSYFRDTIVTDILVMTLLLFVYLLLLSFWDRDVCSPGWLQSWSLQITWNFWSSCLYLSLHLENKQTENKKKLHFIMYLCVYVYVSVYELVCLCVHTSASKDIGLQISM